MLVDLPQVAEELGPFHMNNLIRFAMATGTFLTLIGTPEVDETYIGGLDKHTHKVDRVRKIHGTGGTDKMSIQGALVDFVAPLPLRW